MELLELYLSPIDATRFKVIVTQSPAGEGETESSLPFHDGSQDRRITLIKTLESASFRSESFVGEGEQEWMVEAEILAADRTTFHPNFQARIGKELYHALFPPGSKVERALHSSLRQAEEKNTQLLVQLKLEADAVQRSRLSDYPWELLHDGQRFLLHHQLGFSRYIAHETAPPSLPPVEQVNVLLVSSAAFDSQLGLKRLSKQEQQAIRKGLEKASDVGHICLRELEYPTFNELRTYLTENRGKEAPHVLHFDGHGLYGKRCQQCGAMYKGIKVERCKKEACLAPLPDSQGYLVFEDEEGEADYISAQELGTLLHQTRLSDGTHQTGGVALVVLSACQSAMAVAGESVFNGTAQNLIGHRVPAVVAMQYSVSVEAATKFAEQFYRSLGQKDSLSAAVNQGREAMGAEGNQWYRPVLYLRWRDNQGGQLFATPKPAARFGIPFQAPPLPTYFVDRPEVSQELKQRFLSSSSSKAGTLVVSAIHGLGAIGKSTLAAALAHDEAVKNHFSDGILWATLGQQPDVLSLLSGWVKALGDYNFQSTSVEATSAHLRTLLDNKAVLLVVDDAWNPKDAQHFQVGNSRCQMLVTTRDAAIADTLRASTYSLDVMKPEQAMELLTKKLGRELQDAERQSAEALAEAVGYLPLALELASAQIADGISWAVLLQDIKQEVARLKTFDRPGAKDATDEKDLKTLSLTASLNLSVQRLSQEERQDFTWLGVLPEDVTITQAMTATLWDMDERDAGDTLRYLHSKALLLPGVPLSDGTLTFRLHDLLHDLARNLLTAPGTPKRRGDLPGLGLSLPTAHAQLLEQYRKKTRNQQWHTLPNDGYIHQHLVWHLEQAGWVEEIHKLLEETAHSGRNGWYEAQERLGQTASYVQDVSRAWKLADANQDKTSISRIIGWQCRYALIVASLNSLAKNLPPALLLALVRKKVWTSEQGVAYALQIPDQQQKVEALAQLSGLENYLPAPLKQKILQAALEAARAIQDKSLRVDALRALADKLPESLLPQALEAALAIQDEQYRANALRALADKLPESLLPQALEAALAIESEYIRANALSALADKLPESLLPQALEATLAIQDEWYRANALRALADKLPDVLPQALEAALAIESEEYRANALRALADKLPDVLPQALEAALAIQYEQYRAHALRALADKLPESLLPQALEAALAIESEYIRANALSALADKLPESLLPQALEAALAIQDERYRVDALSALADKLPDVLPQALEAALAIQDERYRTHALSALADKLPKSLLPQALEAALAIEFEYIRANALRALADKLPDVLPQALEAALAIQDEQYRVDALSALADKLPESLLPQALEAALAIQDESYRANALRALADKLPDVLPQALEAALAIQDEWYRADALRALADKLPESLLPQALEAARAIQDEYLRADALRALADKLPESLLPQALEAALAIQDEQYRANALSALADKLPDVLPQALEAALAIQYEGYRADALSALADKLPDVLPQALEAALAIESEQHRANVLSALADKLPESLLPQALEAARAIESKYYRANALSALADKLPDVLPQALEVTLAIQDEQYRAHALSALADKLPESLLPQALEAALAIQDEYLRADALSALADKLPDVLPQALEAALAIESEEYRANVLSALADKLPESLLPQALEAALAIESKYYRANALSALASYLSQMPKAQLFPLWQETLHLLALDTRQSLLSDLAVLVPVIFAFDGQETMAEIFCAIQDVARWWR